MLQVRSRPGHRALSLLFFVSACATGPKDSAAPQTDGAARENAKAPSTEIVRLEPAQPGKLCVPMPAGRGCRLSPFQGTCATVFSASDAELEREFARGYLSLRAAGDRRSLPADPPPLPEHGSVAFVTSGVSTLELKHLAVLLGHDEKIDIHPPSARLGSIVAFGDPYFATAYRVSPEFAAELSSLGSPESLERVARAWDESSREIVPPARFEFSSGSGEDCRALLERIVEVAEDAVDNGRSLYFVQSLSYANPEPCGEGVDCKGFPCAPLAGQKGGAAPACHSPDDACLSSLDCDGRPCLYRPAAQRFECGPVE